MVGEDAVEEGVDAVAVRAGGEAGDTFQGGGEDAVEKSGQEGGAGREGVLEVAQSYACPVGDRPQREWGATGRREDAFGRVQQSRAPLPALGRRPGAHAATPSRAWSAPGPVSSTPRAASGSIARAGAGCCSGNTKATRGGEAVGAEDAVQAQHRSDRGQVVLSAGIGDGRGAGAPSVRDVDAYLGPAALAGGVEEGPAQRGPAFPGGPAEEPGTAQREECAGRGRRAEPDAGGRRAGAEGQREGELFRGVDARDPYRCAADAHGPCVRQRRGEPARRVLDYLEVHAQPVRELDGIRAGPLGRVPAHGDLDPFGAAQVRRRRRSHQTADPAHPGRGEQDGGVGAGRRGWRPAAVGPSTT